MERALALRDVMDHAVRVQRDVSTSKWPRRSRVRRVVVTSVSVSLLALCAYSWVARPKTIWGPGPARIPAARQEASLRVAMFLLAQRVESQRRATGGYPRTLESVSGSVGGGDITYALISDSVFELRSRARGGGTDTPAIVLRSNEAPDKFLGNSIVRIGGERTK